MQFNVVASILLTTFSILKTGYGCENCNKTYNAPCNMKFPFGDEQQMNADVTLNDTNTIICRDRIEIVPEYGRCPFPPEDPTDMKLTDPYIRCPDFPAIPGQGPIPEGVVPATAYAQCKSCDVQLAPDGAAINLKCVACHDLPNVDRPANLTEKDLIYTIYYVEIANYTSVIVQGKENFNP